MTLAAEVRAVISVAEITFSAVGFFFPWPGVKPAMLAVSRHAWRLVRFVFPLTSERGWLEGNETDHRPFGPDQGKNDLMIGIEL